MVTEDKTNKFSFTNPVLVYMLENYYKNHEEVTKFEDNCNNFLNFLETLPKEFEIKQMSLKEWNELLLNDYEKSENQKNGEHNNLIKFVYVISSFKVYHLFKCILKLMNEHNFYCSMPLIRTLTEVVCFTNYNLIRIKEVVANMNLYAGDYLEYNKHGGELEELFKEIKKGSKIPAFYENASDSAKAQNIGKAIDSVSKKEGYESLRAKYSILCEFVHPNVFSNDIFGVITKTYEEDKKNTFLDESKILLIGGEMDKYYRDMPEEYKLMALLYFGSLISVLDMDMNLFTETLKEFFVLEVKRCSVKPAFLDMLNKMPEDDRLRILEEIKKSKISMIKDGN